MNAACIRPARQSDIPEMIGLLEELFSIEEDFDFSAELQRRGLEMLLASPSAQLFVAALDNRVVGMVSAQLTISTAEGNPALLLEDLVVAPDARGRGIGKGLLGSAGEWGASRGAGRIQLLADSGNTAALEFYNRCGWQRTRLICLRKTHQRVNL